MRVASGVRDLDALLGGSLAARCPASSRWQARRRRENGACVSRVRAYADHASLCQTLALHLVLHHLTAYAERPRVDRHDGDLTPNGSQAVSILYRPVVFLFFCIYVCVGA